MIERPPWWVGITVLFAPLFLLAALTENLPSIFSNDRDGATVAATLMALFFLPIVTLTIWQISTSRRILRANKQAIAWGKPKGFKSVGLHKVKLNKDLPLLKYALKRKQTATYPEVLLERTGSDGEKIHLYHFKLPITKYYRLQYLSMFVGLPLFSSLFSVQSRTWTFYRFILPPKQAHRVGEMSLWPRKATEFQTRVKLDDKLTRWQYAELESVEFNESYLLKVPDKIDELTLRRLFRPAFIVELLEATDRKLFFELRDRTLIVGQPGRLVSTNDLDYLETMASKVLTTLETTELNKGAS